MQFFRRCYGSYLRGDSDADRKQAKDELIIPLQNLGFVNYDGKPEIENLLPTSTNNRYIFKWNKETHSSSSDVNKSGLCFQYGLSGNTSGFRFFDGRFHSYGLGNGDTIIIPSTTLYNNLWFIPLINNGFLLSGYYSDELKSFGATQHPASTAVFHITPAFFTPSNFVKALKQHDQKEGVVVNGTDMIGCVIGIFNNVTNEMMYFQTYARLSCSYSNTIHFTQSGDGYCDYIAQNVEAQPIQFKESDITQYQDEYQWTHTNHSQNVCTLIHMPYENKFLDNMFICTTCPNDHPVEGQFFSFGGRNFLGFYKNLVVELPSG